MLGYLVYMRAASAGSKHLLGLFTSQSSHSGVLGSSMRAEMGGT